MQPAHGPRPDDAHAVCLFASSSERVGTEDRSFARALGTAIAQKGWRLVYGGGQVGLMGEAARGALDAGGKVTGIIPGWLHRREVAFHDIDDLVEVDTMYARKALMDARSDAFCVLPGGIGTLDEVLDLLTTRQLGQHGRRLVLADPHAFWDPFIALLRHMQTHGMLRGETIALLERTTTVADAIALLGPGGG